MTAAEAASPTKFSLQNLVIYDMQDGFIFGVDTDITDIIACASDMRFQGNPSNRNKESPFIPRDEWLKLTLEKR